MLSDNFRSPARAITLAVPVILAILMVVGATLGPNDEYAFLPTLQSGKSFPMYGKDFPYYDSAALGRLGPLGGQEYNLIAPLSRDPAAYYALSAVQLLLTAGFLYILCGAFNPGRPALNSLAVLVTVLSPACMLVNFRLLYVEKNVVFLFALMAWLYWRLLRDGGRRWFWALLVLMCANVAIYYKEPVFVAVGAFALAQIFAHRGRDMPAAVHALNWSLLASAAAFALVYAVTVIPHRGAVVYGTNMADTALLTFVRNAANYVLFSDPVPLLVFLPLMLVRAWQVVIRRQPPHELLDGMLVAAVAYCGVFFALNMYSPYYLLPAYVLGLPPTVHYIASGAMSGRAWKLCFWMVVAVTALNTLPLAAHYLTYSKYMAINFDRTMDFLVKDIQRRGEPRRIAVFFDGVDRGGGKGVYFIAGEFLKHRGLSVWNFDLKSVVEARDPTPFVSRPSPLDKPHEVAEVVAREGYAEKDFPFTVFQPGPLPEMHPGDYLVVSPYSTREIDRRYVESLKDGYDLVFESIGEWAIPRITAKTLVKYVLLKINPDRRRFLVTENLLNWPDYYVLIKK